MNSNREIRRCCIAVFCISGLIFALAIAVAASFAFRTYREIHSSRAEITSVNAKISSLSAKISFLDGIKGIVFAEEAAYDGSKESAYPETLGYGRFIFEKCGTFGPWSLESAKAVRAEFFRISEWSGIMFSERPLSRPMYVRIEAPDGASFGTEPSILEMDAAYLFERGAR